MTMLFESRATRDGVLKSGHGERRRAELRPPRGPPRRARGRRGRAARGRRHPHHGPARGHAEGHGPGASRRSWRPSPRRESPPAGPVFAHHLKMDACTSSTSRSASPSAKAVSPSGRVRPGTQPGGRAARTVYRGPYEGLARSVGRLRPLDEGAGAGAGARPLGGLRQGSGVRPRPGGVAHGAESAAARTRNPESLPGSAPARPPPSPARGTAR